MSVAFHLRASLAAAQAAGLAARIAPRQDRLWRRYFSGHPMPVALERVQYQLLHDRLRELPSAYCHHLFRGFRWMADLSHWADPLEWHPFVREHFLEGWPVEETTQYRQMVAIVRGDATGYAWGCETIGDVDRYFVNLQRTVENMRKQGFKSQRELGNRGDEIVVWGTPDGLLVKGSNGRHRMSLANLIGLSTVKVVVAGLHEDWISRHGGDVRRAARALQSPPSFAASPNLPRS